MLAKLTVAGVAGSMLLATVAFAQTQTPAADAPAATTDKAGVKSESVYVASGRMARLEDGRPERLQRQE